MNNAKGNVIILNRCVREKINSAYLWGTYANIDFLSAHAFLMFIRWTQFQFSSSMLYFKTHIYIKALSTCQMVFSEFFVCKKIEKIQINKFLQQGRSVSLLCSVKVSIYYALTLATQVRSLVKAQNFNYIFFSFISLVYLL